MNAAQYDAIEVANSHLTNTLLPSYDDLREQLRRALPFVDAHRKASGGDGDLTALNVRRMLRLTDKTQIDPEAAEAEEHERSLEG